MRITKSIMKVFLLIGLVWGLMSCESNERQTYYLDVVRVFNEFNLSKELKERTEIESKRFRPKLDSLELVLNLAKSGSEEFRFNMIKYQEVRGEEEEYMENIIALSDERIWTQLNVYFKEYGEQMEAKILHGGNGSGGVLYVDKQIDKTDHFLEFANAKFEGE